VALNVAKEKVEAVAEMKAFQFKAAVIDAAMRAVETSATEPPKMLATTTTSDDLNGSVLCENEMLVRIPSLGKSLTLGLIQSEWEIEPMFSGAAWAGSVLWAAASVLCEHCLLNGLVPVAGTSVLELGCGLGIPGMVSAVLGASEVALTEQPQLVPLLEKNLQRNSSFFSLDDLSVGVQPAAFALSWGTVEAQAFLDARGGKRFDTILICDCVFEPLYGDSWKLLCETLFVLADFSTNVLIASERRSDDSIPEFQAMLERDFDLKIVWNSFEEEELDTLLKNSHIQGHKKPLRIISAKRR
jgi:predicted nicotinamide N-methyase